LAPATLPLRTATTGRGLSNLPFSQPLPRRPVSGTGHGHFPGVAPSTIFSFPPATQS
jgi:hypothetical protein